MLNDIRSPLSLLATRRSAKPRDMVAPGPDDDTVARIVAIATRTPDHGKLCPWRLLHIRDRTAFATLLDRAFRTTHPDASAAQAATACAMAHEAPVLIALVSTPREATIPIWEQELSAGAVGMNILHAATALGFLGCWITGWAAYDETVRAGLTRTPAERIAGFFFIGSPARPVEERPRPQPGDIFATWP